MDYMGSKKMKLRPADNACAAWSMLLPDAAEGLLSDPEARALDRHLASCSSCAAELSEAQLGLAWLTVLKEQAPEPPPSLLANILAKTTGPEEDQEFVPARSVPIPAAIPSVTWTHTGDRLRSWLGLGDGAWSSLAQPRLALTGAMAFFSICLTLNLTGVSVRSLDAQTFRKGSLHRTLAETGASVVRSVEGMRIVYRVQSRVSELRAENDASLESGTTH